ncbi:MAG: MFS transporter [Actinobacteria bacterium]|nr:MFS transporter [Actinomycetota bacterium]
MLLWAGQAVSELGTRTAQIAYPLLVLALTGSPAKAGLVGFASRVPFLLFSLPAGALVDRWDRKRIMLVCDAGRAVGVGSIAIALAAGSITFTHILLVAFVEGTMTVFVGPAEFGAIRRLVPRGQIPAAIAQNEGRVYAASLGGPPLGGLLFGLGRGLPFLADAVSYLISFASLLAIKSEFQDSREREPSRLRTEIGEGVRWLWRQSFLRTTFLLAGAGNFVSNGLALIIIVLAQRQGASATTIGLIFALTAVGGLFGAVAAPALQRRVAASHVRIGYHAVYALLVPLLAIASPLSLGFLFALMLFGAPALNAIFGAYQSALVPDRLQGRVESVGGLIAAGAASLGPLSAGLLLEVIGAVPTVLVFAGVAVVVALIAALSRPLRRAPDLAVLPGG